MKFAQENPMHQSDKGAKKAKAETPSEKTSVQSKIAMYEAMAAKKAVVGAQKASHKARNAARAIDNPAEAAAATTDVEQTAVAEQQAIDAAQAASRAAEQAAAAAAASKAAEEAAAEAATKAAEQEAAAEAAAKVAAQAKKDAVRAKLMGEVKADQVVARLRKKAQDKRAATQAAAAQTTAAQSTAAQTTAAQTAAAQKSAVGSYVRSGNSVLEAGGNLADVVVSGASAWGDSADAAKDFAANASWGADGLGVIGAAVGFGVAAHEFKKAKTTEDKGMAVANMGVSAADGVRISASLAGSSFEKGSSAAATATSVLGGAAIAGGAINIGLGGYGMYKAQKQIDKVDGVEGRASAAHDVQLGTSAQLARNNQVNHRDLGASRVARGALMVAGGAVLVATSFTGVGLVLLGAAGLVGLGYLAYKHLWKKAKLRTAVVDRYLEIDKKYEAHKQAVDPPMSLKEFRKTEIAANNNGNGDVNAMYSKIVDEMATVIHQKGVLDGDADYQELIRGLDLQVVVGTTPTKEKILKKIKG